MGSAGVSSVWTSVWARRAHEAMRWARQVSLGAGAAVALEAATRWVWCGGVARCGGDGRYGENESR
jgi:hypothetical protein